MWSKQHRARDRPHVDDPVTQSHRERRRRTMRKLEAAVIALLTLGIMLVAALVRPQKAEAIPAFARKYNTSCTTCHTDFPKLNDFGKAFKDAGFKFPTDDDSFIKVPPVMLGAPAQ